VGEYLHRLNLVLEARQDLVVVARTEDTEIVRRAQALATDADVLLVDGVRSIEQIRQVRAMRHMRRLISLDVIHHLKHRASQAAGTKGLPGPRLVGSMPGCE